MAKDYTSLLDLASRLLNKYGRSVTLVNLSKATDDSGKPWRGTTAVRSTPLDSVTGFATFVPLASQKELGSLTTVDDLQFDIRNLKRGQQLALFDAKASGTKKIEDFDEMIDDSERWRIMRVLGLKPGGTQLLYYLVVEQ